MNTLKNILMIISSLGGLLGLIGGGIALHDKYYVMPNQNISQLSKNDQIIAKRLDKINKELDELKKALSDFKEGNPNLIDLSSKLSKIQNNILELQNKTVSYKIFNQYYHLTIDEVNSIKTSIKNLQGIENLSNQISYWKAEIENIKARYCNYNDCIEKKNLDLKDAQKNLHELQKLSPK